MVWSMAEQRLTMGWPFAAAPQLPGVPLEMLAQGLWKARTGRLHVLDKMAEGQATHRGWACLALQQIG